MNGMRCCCEGCRRMTLICHNSVEASCNHPLHHAEDLQISHLRGHLADRPHLQAFTGEDAAAGVRRLLQGCYVNIDDALSRLRTLHVAQPPSDDRIKNQLTRPGNGSVALVEH